MTTNPTMDEQTFLATLQECLQADNEKRTAAEVCNPFILFLLYSFIFQAIYQEIPDEQKTILLMSTLRNLALGPSVSADYRQRCPKKFNLSSFEHSLLCYFDDYFKVNLKISGINIPLINKWH